MNHCKIPIISPGARFSKVPKSFWARKATTEISNLKFTELFFSHIFNMNKFSLHAKFHAYTLLRFLKFGQLKMALQVRNVFGAFEKQAPGHIFVQKVVLLGLFSGELIFGGAYYWKEFCVSK